MKWRFTSVLLALFVSFAGIAEDLYETSKEDRWTYAVGQYAEFELESKHGSITLVTWEKDSIAIDAKTTAFQHAQNTNPHAL